MYAFEYHNLPFTIYEQHNLIIVYAQDNVLFEELIGHTDEFMHHPKFRPGMNVLYDMRSVSKLSGDLEVLIDSIERLNDEHYIPVPAQTVFVVRPESSVSRLLEGFCIMTTYTRVPHTIAYSFRGGLFALGCTQEQLDEIDFTAENRLKNDD